MHRFEFRKRRLYCEEVPVDTLAATYGTPLYVYSRNTMLDHFTRLDSALAGIDHTICFAVKANSNLAVLRTFARAGAGFDIVSAGELYRVIAAGGDPRKAVFAGVGKTEDEIAFALGKRILFFSVESDVELARINAVARRLKTTARFCIRVNPNVDAHTHKYITTGTHENKFGLDFATAGKVYAAAGRMKNVRAVVVQMHIGSQITTTRPYQMAVGKLLAFVAGLRALGVDVQYVDIGGGMGIVYRDETPPTPVAFANAVAGRLKEFGATILFEPGRFLVGSGGILVTRVQYIKKTAHKTFVIVDGGMNDLIRPALYEAYHEIVPCVRRAGKGLVADVVGPICESGDFFAKDRALPALKAGDAIALMSAGAYGFVMSSNYNTRPRAAEIMVDGAKHRVVRRRETWDDLLAPERG
ncbi:diaminopimelate decarboxylase [bacterium]|nr:diaminopimelate decarboxylase [bacterium]